MIFDFDREIERTGTACLKFDRRLDYFGNDKVIPLWIADMDFAAPEAVTRALAVRAAHPIYGYSYYPESLFEAFVAWLDRRFGWKIQREWIVMCPGVVPSLHAAILAYTQPGDGVIIQPPVYAPFFSSVEQTGRRIAVNPLRLENGRYSFDLAHLRSCAEQGARMLLLCSPHNPVGRVWTAAELTELLECCAHHGITIVSDEIHADLVYPGHQHLPLAMLAGNPANIITAAAPSKTFNIPGLGLSVLVVPGKQQRVSLQQAFGTLQVGAANPFSICAFEAAYRAGEPWLDSLLPYLDANRAYVKNFLSAMIPEIKLMQSQGTYLLWLDCNEMGMSDAQLKRFFIQEANVGLSPGILFGPQGSGFMRMNIGAPLHTIRTALENIAQARRK
ncbi:MAG: PatB family C-S lyase [Pseudomonadota bacterium]